MPTTEYPKNPNVDTAFVTDDNNKRNRALKTVLVDGTIDYPKNANSTDCYVTIDGKKQRAMMTADISGEGTLEYPNNSNSTKGYVTVNGKKQRVILTAALAGGGSAPVIDELNVTPSTSAQTITASGGVDGYSPVNVAAVDASIDANIVAGNIKNGVEILGVTGNVIELNGETKTVTPQVYGQTLYPTSPKNAITEITVNAVTSSIDANIQAGNIKKDVSILGVTGTYEGTTPTGTKSITANGIYDVTDFATADVQVPTTAPASYRAFEKNSSGTLVNSTSTPWVPLPAGTTDISAYCFYRAYYSTPSSVLSGEIDLSSLTTLSGSNAMSFCFFGCAGVTRVDLSSLTTISGTNSMDHCFSNCTSLTTVDLSSLTTISGSGLMGNCFSNCTSLTTVDLSSLMDFSQLDSTVFFGCVNLSNVILNPDAGKRNPGNTFRNIPLTTRPFTNCEYITGQVNGIYEGMHFSDGSMDKFELCNTSVTDMFKGNTYLTTANFPVLTRFNGAGCAAGMFQGCTNIGFTDLYFPMLCVFRNAVPFTTTSFPSQVTVHFRKDQQTLIEGTTGASSNFGAAALVFDQIGTITINSVDYIREGKCNETGYYAWHKSTSNITVDGVVYIYSQADITRNTAPVSAGPMLYGWKNGTTTIFTDSLKPQVGDFIYTAFNSAQSTTQSISAVDNDFVYTVAGAEPEVGDTVYSDAQGTVLGTIDSIA